MLSIMHICSTIPRSVFCLSVKARQTFLSILNLIDFSRVYTARLSPQNFILTQK
jgi:hypothetical protein